VHPRRLNRQGDTIVTDSSRGVWFDFHFVHIKLVVQLFALCACLASAARGKDHVVIVVMVADYEKV
jgi:hypothetical protein